MILSTTASQGLAAALASQLDGDALASVEFERFPDGELLAAAPGFDDERAIIVASTTSSDAHIELLQLQDAAREAGASEVVTVIPYLGYARQDTPVAPGHTAEDTPAGYPLSVRAVARALSTGTDRVLTVNPHERGVCEHFEVPADSVDAAGRLADPLPALEDPVFLAPDAGARELARSVRDAAGEGDLDHFEKTRLSASEVELSPSDVAVAGRDVVVVDDIIATGSTMSEAIEVLTARNAARVFVSCVHPLLAGSAETKLARAGVEAIIGTDTIEGAVSEVSVAPAIADEL